MILNAGVIGEGLEFDFAAQAKIAGFDLENEVGDPVLGIRIRPVLLDAGRVVRVETTDFGEAAEEEGLGMVRTGGLAPVPSRGAVVLLP